MRQATNCFLIDKDNKVVLAMKKRGFGVGKWNGAGGKIKDGEKVEDTAVREVKEEIGVVVLPSDLEKVAEINYSNGDPNWGMFVHIFKTTKWQGELQESEEMKPQLFELKDVPFDQCWSDMRHWLPRIIAGEKIKADFLYKPDGESIDHFEIEKLNLADIDFI